MTVADQLRFVRVTQRLGDVFLQRAESSILSIGQMALWKGPIEDASANGLIFPPTDPLKGINETPPSSLVAVALDGNTIIGYLIVRLGSGLMSYSHGLNEQYGHLGKMAFVRSVAVAERYRGRFIAAHLMLELMPELCYQKCAFVGMHIRHGPIANSSGIRSMQRNGFMKTDFTVRVPVRTDFFGFESQQLIPTETIDIDYVGYIRPVQASSFMRAGNFVTPEMCEKIPLNPDGLELVQTA